jgi:hypothetical protein
MLYLTPVKLYYHLKNNKHNAIRKKTSCIWVWVSGVIFFTLKLASPPNQISHSRAAGIYFFQPSRFFRFLLFFFPFRPLSLVLYHQYHDRLFFGHVYGLSFILTAAR